MHTPFTYALAECRRVQDPTRFTYITTVDADADTVRSYASRIRTFPNGTLLRREAFGDDVQNQFVVVYHVNTYVSYLRSPFLFSSVLIHHRAREATQATDDGAWLHRSDGPATIQHKMKNGQLALILMMFINSGRPTRHEMDNRVFMHN